MFLKLRRFHISQDHLCLDERMGINLILTDKVMKEGYYISAFVCINELQNILNIKIRHDQAIALWKYYNNRVELIRYWELERISGIKMHPKALYNEEKFYELLSNLLEEEGLKLKDIIGIWGTKGIEPDCYYRNWFDSKYAFHSLAHLLTALFYNNSSPFDDSILAMALDAGPDSMFEVDAYEKYYYSACAIKDGEIQYFPVESPASLWSYSRKRFGLREGTLMALATAMDTKCSVDRTLLERWESYEFFDKNSRKNAQKLVDSVYQYVVTYTENIEVKYDERFSIEENQLSMMVKIINQLSLDIVCRNIDSAIIKYKIDPLNTIIALSGGFSLNCPTNSKIIERYAFKGYQIPPCASDTGIALGIGLALFYKLLVTDKAKVYINSAYYGQKTGNIYNIQEHMQEKVNAVYTASMNDYAKLLDKGEVLVWINDFAEIGPRALGNRSLIADPRSNNIKDKLNYIKKRQWWRPVAPIILDEYGDEYFINYRSTYNMLLNLYVKANKWKKIEGVIHNDGSARVQSVSERSNSMLYKLLSAFYDITGVPVLCNTSLNDAGEPIINRIDEAIKFAVNKGLKYVCVDGKYIIEVISDTSSMNNLPMLRQMEYFNPPIDVDVDDIIRKKNPYNLTVNELTYFFDNPNIFDRMDITSYEDVLIIRNRTKNYLERNKFGLIR